MAQAAESVEAQQAQAAHLEHAARLAAMLRRVDDAGGARVGGEECAAAAEEAPPDAVEVPADLLLDEADEAGLGRLKKNNIQINMINNKIDRQRRIRHCCIKIIVNNKCIVFN